MNDAPATTPVTLTAIAEDSGARLITQAELLANASDVDSPSLTATNLQIASGNGTLVDNGNGTWTYTPALNDDTSVTFSYAVTDGVAAPVAKRDARHHAGERRAGDDAGDACGDRRGQRRTADHPGRAARQCHRCRRSVADGDQAADHLRQRHARQQWQRHLELHAGAQRRHRGDVQLQRSPMASRRRSRPGQPRHHPGERCADDDAGDADGDCRGQRGTAYHPGRATGQCQRCR